MRRRKRAAESALSFEAYGVPVEVAFGDPALRPEIEQMLPPGHRPVSVEHADGHFTLRQTGEDEYDVIVGEEPWLEHATRDVALGMLDAQIRLFIASHAQDHLFVHAGVVSIVGRAIVIPGESFSGKTTLVRALLEAGATYYSDEYAVLDQAGRVHPYPRRLSIRSENSHVADDRHATDFGGEIAAQSADVAGVVITRYRSGAEWAPRQLSRARGVVALLENTVPAQDRPEEALKALRSAVREATILESDRGEAAPVAAALMKAFAEPPGAD